MSRNLTYKPKPQWCKGCKKTARVVRYKQDGAFVTRCRQCAESDGRTVESRQGIGGKVFTSKTGAAARKKQITDVDLMYRANQARRVKSVQRVNKRAQARRMALMEGMIGTNGLGNHFRMNGVCRGCKGRVPVVQAVYVDKSAFVTPNKTPTVLCRGCVE